MMATIMIMIHWRRHKEALQTERAFCRPSWGMTTTMIMTITMTTTMKMIRSRGNIKTPGECGCVRVRVRVRVCVCSVLFIFKVIQGEQCLNWNFFIERLSRKADQND